MTARLPVPGPTTTAPPSAAERIGAWSRGIDASAIDADVVRRCGGALADTFGVAAGGTREHAARAALDYLRRAGLLQSRDAGGPTASLWGTHERAAPEIAAWWNGVAGHVLDYDDVTPPLRGHPSVVLWPALLALAESRALPSSRLAPAFVVGMEVLCKLARSIAVAHYARGWHATASIGAIGSAVACAHLLDLSTDQVAHAIGLAVAQAAGTRENVGNEGKSFQAGHANAAGVRAACLAEAGFEAGARTLDGPHGYLALYADGEDATPVFAELGAAPFELVRSGLDVKQYPMCYATHRALDGILDLRAAHGLALDDVAHVRVTTSHGALEPLVHPRPRTGLEGKFSLQYALAAALADGAVRLASFTDEAVARPALQAFFARVDVVEADGPVSPRWTRLDVTLRDGRTLDAHVATLRGSSQTPASDAALVAKLDDCLAWGGHRARGDALLARSRDLAAADGRALVHDLQRLILDGDPT